jgi:hypothetical protein
VLSPLVPGYSADCGDTHHLIGQFATGSPTDRIEQLPNAIISIIQPFSIFRPRAFFDLDSRDIIDIVDSRVCAGLLRTVFRFRAMI